DVPSVPAVPAVGPAEGFELLPADRGGTVSTVPAAHVQVDAVNEGGHVGDLLSRKSGRRNGPLRFRLFDKLLFLGVSRNDLDDPAPAPVGELDAACRECEQGVVAALPDVDAGVELRAALTDEDLTGVDGLTAKPLHTQA